MDEQIELFELISPCRGICQMNEQGYCQGCYRSREERFHWLIYNDHQKRNILRLCRQRKYRRIKCNDESELEQIQLDLFNK